MDLCAGSRPGHVEKGPDSLSRESRKKAHHSPITQLVEYQTVKGNFVPRFAIWKPQVQSLLGESMSEILTHKLLTVSACMRDSEIFPRKSI